MMKQLRPAVTPVLDAQVWRWARAAWRATSKDSPDLLAICWREDLTIAPGRAWAYMQRVELSPKWWPTLAPATRRYLVIHEVVHITAGALARHGPRFDRLLDVALEAVPNETDGQDQLEAAERPEPRAYEAPALPVGMRPVPATPRDLEALGNAGTLGSVRAAWPRVGQYKPSPAALLPVVHFPD